MAVVTLRFGAFDNESVWFGCDWDDANGDVVAIRVVNGSDQTVFLRLEGTGSGPAGRSREGTFQPGTTVIAIPAGQRPRFPVVVTDGVADLGSYKVSVRWPA
jgi:hypothetical protein